ncbi:MAG TPA: ABC transporter permease, partial [Clostridiales bacterium]|nr:ABC transporter permease [Clostridiales bacterium]
TRVGLNLRAVGENPATADAMGVNVNGYKYFSILIGSSIAGIGGLYYIVNNSGVWDNSSTLEAYGWLALALVIFTTWRPVIAIFGAILFGLLDRFGSFAFLFNIKLNPFGKVLMDILPYLVTLIVLIVTSIIGKKETQPPSSLGLNYFKEDR